MKTKAVNLQESRGGSNIGPGLGSPMYRLPYSRGIISNVLASFEFLIFVAVYALNSVLLFCQHSYRRAAFPLFRRNSSAANSVLKMS